MNPMDNAFGDEPQDAVEAGASKNRTKAEEEAAELVYLRELDRLRQEAGITAAMLRDGRATDMAALWQKCARQVRDRTTAPKMPSQESRMMEGAVGIAEYQQHRADELQARLDSLAKRHEKVLETLQKAHSWIGGISYSEACAKEAEIIIDLMGNTIYEDCTAQAYDDLAASGGIVDAP
jgi:hypothetical protein